MVTLEDLFCSVISPIKNVIRVPMERIRVSMSDTESKNNGKVIGKSQYIYVKISLREPTNIIIA